MTPVSSGFSIGSCNWIVRGPQQEKIVYVGQCTRYQRHQRHPASFDLSPLLSANVVVLSSVVERHEETQLGTELGNLTARIEETLKEGGHVLLPVSSAGVLFDLFEVIFGHLQVRGLGHTRVFFISPIAKQSLAYSTITGEWLNAKNLDKVYASDAPFTHNALMSGGLLDALDDVNEVLPFQSANGRSKGEGSSTGGGGGLPQFRSATVFDLHQPCIVFTGHPSLRFGPVLQLLLRWYESSKNVMILTEPGFVDVQRANEKIRNIALNNQKYASKSAAATATASTTSSNSNASSASSSQPQQPSAIPTTPAAQAAVNSYMRVFAIPIDLRLRASQAHDLLRALQPRHVIIPSRFENVLLRCFQEGASLSCSITKVSLLEAIKLSLRGQFENGFITERLNAQLKPVQVGDTALVRVRALLRREERGFVLDALPDPVPESLKKEFARVEPVSAPLLWGSFLPEVLIASLKKRGVNDVLITQKASKKQKKTERTLDEDLARGHVRLEIPSLAARLVLKPGSSQITTEVNASRILLRDVLLEHLIRT